MAMVHFKLDGIHTQASALLKEMIGVQNRIDNAASDVEKSLVPSLQKQLEGMEGRYKRIVRKMTVVGTSGLSAVEAEADEVSVAAAPALGVAKAEVAAVAAQAGAAEASVVKTVTQFVTKPMGIRDIFSSRSATVFLVAAVSAGSSLGFLAGHFLGH